MVPGADAEATPHHLREENSSLRAEVDALRRELASLRERRDAEAGGAEDLRHQFDRLREFDGFRTRFFANVSHELRTPLTLILGPVRKLLKHEGLSEETRRDLQVVERNAGLLLKHVGNLLDLSKLEAGAMVPHYAQIDLARLARFVASHFDVLAQEKRIRFEVAGPEALPAQVDPEKVQRILLNVLSNAFKFAPPEGTVRFTAAEQTGEAVLEIHDSGTGISAELRQSVFERFRQGDCETARLGGTGLGLSIVHEFVALHRGSVSVGESPLGGALFMIRLPLTAPPGSRIRDSQEDADAETSRQFVDQLRTWTSPPSEQSAPRADAPLVLVIEDNRDMNAFLVETLSRECRVVTAFDGQEGLQKAVELVPDLILSDVMMPRMCGEEMVRELRKHRELDSVPIVLLTAKADQEVRLNLLKAGVVSYLDKPFSAEELLVRVDRLIADRHSNVRSVRRAYALLRAVTEGITDSVFVKDLSGRYLMINSAGAAAVGRSVEEVLGRDDGELFPEETARRILQEDRQVIEEGRTRTFENVAIGPEGPRTYLATRTPYRDQERNIIGVMGIARDITERKRVEQELREAKEAAEAANQSKDRFLAMLSHELRTPLTPVLATVTYLETRPELSADLRRDITMIRRNVEMEARLIDDLLDLTRISRGKVELHYEALDAHASLRRALEICQQDIESNRLELSLSLWAERYHIWADPARMQQVFWNLINNAVKFTPKGGRITLRTLNDEQGLLVIQIRDTGIGISAEALPRIFHAFEQGEGTRHRQFGGLGLGLAISKALVELHQAELTAASEGPDRGSEFTLRINTIEQAAATPEVSRRTPGTARPRHLRILLVEDHKDTRTMMASLLRMLGHQVETAANVCEALEEGKRREFDLLISDIGLPDGSGLEIMRSLKREQGLRGIALSGFGMDDDILQSRAAGFEEHLTKPIDLQTLERVIQEVAEQAETAAVV